MADFERWGIYEADVPLREEEIIQHEHFRLAAKRYRNNLEKPINIV